jgi:hypothetical protein
MAVEMARSARWPVIGLSDEPRRRAIPVALLVAERCRAVGLDVGEPLVDAAPEGGVAEMFLAMLRHDVLDCRVWTLREEAGGAITEWIENYYNPQAGSGRRKSINEELDELSL